MNRRPWRLPALLLAGALGWALLMPPTGLRAWAFPTENERSFHAEWLNHQLGVYAYPAPRAQRPQPLLTSYDHTGNLQIPRDLRVGELPGLVADLEAYALGGDRPAFGLGRTLASSAQLALAVARTHRPWPGTGWWHAWWLRRLEGSLGAVARQTPAATGDLDAWVRQTHPDPEQQALLRAFLADLRRAPSQVESRLAAFWTDHLAVGLFDLGAQRLARRLTVFSAWDLEVFRRQRKLLEEPTDPLPEIPRRLWEALEIDGRAQALIAARCRQEAARVAELERQALKAILVEVHRFPWSLEDGEGSRGAPAQMLATKDLRCLGMSTLMHALLRNLGIRHEALAMPQHVALLATTADGRTWVLDATRDAEVRPLAIPLPADQDVRAEAMGYEDHVSRRPAQSFLAAALLWNLSMHLHLGPDPTRQPWRRRFLAWNPDDLNALQSFHRASRHPEAARAWLLRILTRTPHDPAANLDLWALGQEKGRKREAQDAWERAMGRR